LALSRQNLYLDQHQRAIAAGEFDVVTDHVEQSTGHRPVGVREFLSRPKG